METIREWQTLIGSILGALIALITALIVALSVKRREELASGMVVSSNLIAVKTACEALNFLAKEQEISDKDIPLWLSEKLVNSHPSLSVLFESSFARIMPIDEYMAAHLSLFYSIYSGLEIILERLTRDLNKFHEQGKPLRPQEHIRADADIITRKFKLAVRHAECAESLISKLILSKASTWYRLKRRVWMNQEEKKCLGFLRGVNN